MNTLMKIIFLALVALTTAHKPPKGPKPPKSPHAPGYDFLYTVNVTLGERWSYGDFAQGSRVAIPIVGGTFSGPKLSGTVMDLGADWGVTDTQGVFFPDTRYSLRTDDGADVYIQTYGPTQPDGRTILRGQFQTGHPEYLWLNYVVAVGILNRPTGNDAGKYVMIDMWEVTLPKK